jgi:hypothetical protein
MAFIAPAIPYILAATTVMSGVASYQQGRAQDDVAKYEAEQMRANAERIAQDGIKRAEETRRQKRIYLSNARAAQASSGGTTTDSGALSELGKIGGIFEYNAMEELYGSALDANAMAAQAHSRRFEGRMAKRSGTVALGTSVLSAFGGMYGSGAMGGTAKQPPAPVTTSLPSYSTTSYPGTITRKLPARTLS